MILLGVCIISFLTEQKAAVENEKIIHPADWRIGIKHVSCVCVYACGLKLN